MTALTVEEATERVANGVKFLDEYRPAWRLSVDTRLLTMYDPFFCVLGQVFGRYREAVQRYDMSIAEQEHYGFLVYSAGRTEDETRESWAILTAAWLAELAPIDA